MTLVALPRRRSGSLFLTGKCSGIIPAACQPWNLTPCKPASSVAKSCHGRSSLSVQILQQCRYPDSHTTALHHIIYAFYLSAGDPVCSQRLHSVLVLYPQWGWIFFIGDQTDVAECPRAVLHKVYDTHTHTCIYALCWMHSTFCFIIDLMQNYSQGPKRWTGSLTSPLAWLMTLPLIYECFEKPKIALQTERTSKVSCGWPLASAPIQNSRWLERVQQM